MSRVLVLADYESCTKQTFCYLFYHGLSRDVGGFQKTRDYFLAKSKKLLVNQTRWSSKRFSKLNYEWQTVYSASPFSSAEQ